MLDLLRSRAGRITGPIAKFFGAVGFTPNSLSASSVLFAFIAAVFYYYSSGIPRLLFFAGLMTCICALMDAIDGALARQVGETKRGDFLDHIMDRYADIFIVCGISFGGYASLEIGIAAITGILVSSYIATQGQAVHMGRYYGGFGRADRLVLIIIVTFVNWMYLDEIYGLSVLGWSLLVLAVLSHSTGIYRFFYVWKRLE